MTQRVTQIVKLVDRQLPHESRVTQVVKLVDRQPQADIRVTQIVKLVDREVPQAAPVRRRASFF